VRRDDHALATAAISRDTGEETEEHVREEREDRDEARRRGVAAGVQHEPGQTTRPTPAPSESNS